MHYNQQQQHAILQDEDQAYSILADLKRVTREYATAATESSCDQVRQMFTSLLNSTLHLQGELYKMMKQNNMYSAASPCLRQEIDKQLQQNKQTLDKTQQFVQGLVGQGGGMGRPGFASVSMPQHIPPTQMQQPQHPNNYM